MHAGLWSRRGPRPSVDPEKSTILSIIAPYEFDMILSSIINCSSTLISWTHLPCFVLYQFHFCSLFFTILHNFYNQITRISDKMAPKILIVLTSQEKFEDKNGVTLQDKPTGWFLVRRLITKPPLH